MAPELLAVAFFSSVVGSIIGTAITRRDLKRALALQAARDKARREALADGIRALLGLHTLLRNRPDITPEISDALRVGHRITEANRALALHEEG